MSPLWQRMIEVMQLRGLAPHTQRAYLQAIQRLALYYYNSPDQITEEELRQYFLYLHHEKHIARSTAIMCSEVEYNARGISAHSLLSTEALMAYDEALAQRIRAALTVVPGLTEKKMFGGTAFMVDGNMACGVTQNNLMVRMNPDATAAALARPNVRLFDMTGRPMKGWVIVEPAGVQAEDDLRHWITQGVAFAQSLPPK